MNESPIFQELKKRITLLEYKPGEVLREKEIMEDFDVSRTPVREALIRLEMEGLVRIIPNQGTFVADVSFQQLKDVFEIRSFMVRLTGQLAAARITEGELDEIHERIERMKQTHDPKMLMQIDGELHDIINRATKNEALVKILGTLHNQAVRIWTYSHAENQYWSGLVAEFEEIEAALRRRDEKETACLLEKHTRRFVDHIRSQFAT
jgi:GntR family transcriptional regulator, rspAB operon transcriptional repressor